MPRRRLSITLDGTTGPPRGVLRRRAVCANPVLVEGEAEPQGALEGPLLNGPQSEAARHVDGPMVVFAGAGSGKTRTIVYRLARLVESGVSPAEILLLTFTRKASAENTGAGEPMRQSKLPMRARSWARARRL